MTTSATLVTVAGQGPPGIAAYTQTTANFTMPAVGSSVSVSVVTTTWMAVGQALFVATAGVLTIASITDKLTVVLTNPSPIILSNAAAATTILSGSQVSPSGTPGTPGATLGALWTDVAAGAVVTCATGLAYAADCTGSAVTFNLSATPSDGDSVLVHLVGSTCPNGATINAAGSGITIEGDNGLVSGTAKTLTVPGAMAALKYRASIKQWLAFIYSGVPGITTAAASNDFTLPTSRYAVASDKETYEDVQKFISQNATANVMYTEAPPAASSTYDYVITVFGANAVGDSYRADFFFTAQRIGSASMSYVGSAPSASNVRTNGAGSGYVASVALSGTNGAVRVSSTTTSGGVAWTVSFRRVKATNPGPFQISWLGSKIIADFNPIAGQVTVVSGHATSITDAMNGHVATNTGASPLWFATGGGISGNAPYLQSDGISQAMRSAFTYAQPEEVFVLANWTNSSGGATLFDGAANFNTGRMSIAGPTNQINLNADATPKADTYANAFGVWQVYDAMFSGASSFLTVGGNPGTLWPQTLGTNSMGGITLFAMGDAGAGSSPSVAKLTRCVCATGLTSGDRTQLLAFLNAL